MNTFFFDGLAAGQAYHLVHPDIWMLWFSIIVSACVAGRELAKVGGWLLGLIYRWFTY